MLTLSKTSDTTPISIEFTLMNVKPEELSAQLLIKGIPYVVPVVNGTATVSIPKSTATAITTEVFFAELTVSQGAKTLVIQNEIGRVVNGAASGNKIGVVVQPEFPVPKIGPGGGGGGGISEDKCREISTSVVKELGWANVFFTDNVANGTTLSPESGANNAYKFASGVTAFSIELPDGVTYDGKTKDRGFFLHLDLTALSAGSTVTVTWNPSEKDISFSFPDGEDEASLSPKAGEIWEYSFVESKPNVLSVGHRVAELGS